MNPAPPDLRSPADTVGGIVYFARMIDKIRLHAAGQLPADLRENVGKGFDARCAHFLGISHAALTERMQQGNLDDETLLEWCFTHGRRPAQEDIEVWNGFMRKRGLRDEATEVLRKRKRDNGLADRADIETMFQFIDADEGRPLRPFDDL